METQQWAEADLIHKVVPTIRPEKPRAIFRRIFTRCGAATGSLIGAF
jgi:hypothetical protein